MLEGLVATLLNRFLGMYVKNFDAKQLQVGIWSGEVTLKNLELRREALDQLRLPVNVVKGHLGQLTLSIPFSNLRGKPVKVNIEDVILLAAPKEDAEYNEEEERRRTQAVKMEKLESAELLKERNTEGLSQEEQQKNQSFTESLVTAIIDNLQVSVKNIHLRYEDSIAAPGHPFALGFTLKEFSAVSTDENWRPTFLQSSTGTTHKLATLGSLAFYWNTDAELFGTGKGTDVGAEGQGVAHDDLMSKFKAIIEKGETQQYILEPVSGRAGIEMNKTGKVEMPKVRARLLFNELGFVVDDDQYRDALMMVDLFHYFLRHQEYKKYQPKKSRKEDPRAWIRFAGEAVLRKIHDRNVRWTWEFMRQRRDDRIRYIELFKKKKKAQTMTAAEQEELQKLEEKLTYEDLRFWRSLARNQLRKENVGVKKPEPKQTWGSWVWGSGKKPEAQHHEEESTEMTEEQRKELYDAIDWDEKKAIAESVDVPKESIKLQIESSLRTGSFTLKRNPHGSATEILNLMFDNFQAKILQRPDSMLADISLGGLRVYDGTTEGTLFPQIVKVKDTESVPKDHSIEGSDQPSQTLDVKQEDKEAVEDSLFHLIFEQNPLDGSADSSILLKLKSIEVIYNPKFVVEIANFFKPPERHMESIGALLETAGATVEGIRQQTRAGLEFALQEHKTMNAQLDIHAPLIIIPESITKKSTLCLILDAGHVGLNSELVDKETMREIQSKQKTQYSESDYKQLEGLMYDKFILKLDSTQVLIGPGIEATRKQLTSDSDSQSYHIIDRINMDFVLETSIIPKATDLTKTRISGHLPVLHASISDRKYKDLMKLIDIAIPKFDTDESLDGRTKAPVKSPRALKAESSARADRPKDTESRPRSKSFQVQTQMHDIVLDEDTDDEKPGAGKSSKASKNEDVNLYQRNFEFNFTVDLLQGSLYRADPTESKPDQLLVELVAEHFHLGFYLRPYDMVAEVLLRSLSVEDHIEHNPSPAFKNIVSSQDIHEKDEKDLFNLKFVKVNKDSPDFESTYESIATNLDVSISTLNLVVTRKTLLTLLDFVLVTFASPNESQQLDSAESASKEQSQQRPDAQPTKNADKIRIKVVLHRIALVLNNDGIRLATLSLHTADVGIFLVEGSMRIGARLGSLSLVDDINQGASEESSLRQLITIQGDELADFRYQTYDPKGASYPGYDSKVFLRSGSIKVNFVEEPFRKIINFLVKFGKMQAIFNAARQAAANQASQIQEGASKMVFDLVIKTPIVVFPRVMVQHQRRDLLTAYLGEIYASNKFATVKGSANGTSVNKLSAGIRNIRLTSNFHYRDDQSEELEMIEKVDLDFKIKYLEHEAGIQRPDLEVEGTMSPVNLRITQTQLKFLLELSKTVPAAFSADSDESEEEVLRELPGPIVEPAKRVTDLGSDQDGEEKMVSHQSPELGSSPETWTKLDLAFKAEKIGLELLLAKEDQPVGDVEAASLSNFSINGTHIKLRMLSDGALESELLIHSFSITDSRTREINKFRKIMSLINDDVKQQFMASISISGGPDKHLIAMVTLDSPRIIFAMEYVFALVAYANSAFATEDALEVEDASQDDNGNPEEQESAPNTPVNRTVSTLETKSDTPASSSAMTMSFRVNIEDAQVILIANPTITNSEAIVLGTKQVLVSQQNASTLQITKVGMFLCRMDKFETSRLRILDDFSVIMSMDVRSQGKQSSLTSIHVDIEPLVLRLSLRDILLALQIVNRASEMTSDKNEETIEDTEPKKIKQVKASGTPSTKQKSAGRRPTSTVAKRSSRSVATSRLSRPEQGAKPQESSVMKREEMTAEIQGIRVILIGDLHELPLIDWSVKKFNVDVRDWSESMTGDTSFDTYINVYNFSKSAWEPLIEPWQLGFHLSKEQRPDRLAVEVYSHKTMELTVTSATIALASKSAQFLSTDEDVLSKPRGADSPYRIRNYTGFDLNVWAATREEDQGPAAKLSDGEETPWRFEDATTMRESLSPEGSTGIVGVKLEGSGFDSIERIPVNREGETLYNLKPRQDKILHRLLVEVKLGADNVKYITFRSPLLVENNTQIPIEVGVFSPEEGLLVKIEKILPGEGRPAPVGAAFKHSLVVRPDQGFGYTWSHERLFWQDLLKRPTRTVTCKAESGDQSPLFHFQMNANFDKNNPISR
jgi:vacuolar protein sorting-associated protein 13A/C